MKKGTREHARQALDDYVAYAFDSGQAEADPYGFASVVIATALEFALDDGISGSMNQHEFDTLDLLAKVFSLSDPDIDLQPRPA